MTNINTVKKLREYWIDEPSKKNPQHHIASSVYRTGCTHAIEYSAYTEAISRAEKDERKLVKCQEQRNKLLSSVWDDLEENGAIYREQSERADIADYDAELEAVEGER